MRHTLPAWFAPCAAITALVYLAGAVLMPLSGLGAALPVVDFVLGWLALMGGVALLGATALARRLGRSGEQQTGRAMLAWARQNRDLLGETAAGLALYGLLAMGFNWIKVQLNAVFPFWADRLFADLDHALFGTDPYLLLHQWLGPAIIGIDLVYSMWFPSIVVSLAWVFLRRDNAAIIAFFVMWGLFGTVLQALFSSAGPIFWARIGLGDRFDPLFGQLPRGTQMIADYLWASHGAQAHTLGAGISAMPSMHVGMACWVALCFAHSRWRWWALAYLAIVLTGSVALGWHYFVDGLVGVASALGAFALARLLLGRAQGGARADAAPLPAR